MTEFFVEVSYSQLAVFDAHMRSPFNDWSDAHVAQGFTWRLGSVSFGTLQSAGTVRVRVFLNGLFNESTSTAARILLVPFPVPPDGEVEIGSIGGGVKLALPPGEYELVFEHGQDSENGFWVNLWFRETGTAVQAKVIRADPELDPPSELVMNAQPA